jgi:hypothetical protein
MRLAWNPMEARRVGGLLSRCVAAVIGGYAVAALGSVALARLGSRVEGALTGMMASYAIYTAAVIWVFAAPSALRAWLGLAAAAGVFGAAFWLLGVS